MIDPAEGGGRWPKLRVVSHPLVQHKLTRMRDRRTETAEFRRLLKEIALLMGFELTRDLPLETRRVETPLAPHDGAHLSGPAPAIVPILRAGLIMADGLLELIPTACLGHLGLARDHETKRPVEYLVSLPPPEGRRFIVVDPMLATGGSAAHACRVLADHGVPPGAMRFLALVAAPEGLDRFFATWPDVETCVAAVDARLDARAYIIPGLGDAGDRMFGT